VKGFAWSLLLIAAAPACVLVQPLDEATPGTGGGSSNGGSSARAGSTSSGGSGAIQGSQGGICYANGTCNAGLACTFGVCTTPTGAGGAGGSSGSSGSTGTGATGPYCASALAPCGGSLIGTWSFKSSCLTLPTDDTTVPAACQGLETVSSYLFSGTATYTSSSWQASITDDEQYAFKYTTACITALNAADGTFPAPPASATTCSTLETGLEDANTTVSCVYVATGGGSCNCSFVYSNTATFGDDYTLMGTNSYVNATDPVGWSPVTYCVQGTTLTISQTSPAGFTDVHALTKM
jgi:hypothetical protein